jgi:hypothetical protein
MSYAQMAKKRMQKKKDSNQTVSQRISQKQQQKELEREKYRQKRLIVQMNKKTADDFDSYTLRNLINDRFFVKENVSQPVVAAVTKSFTSQLIVLTTMSAFSADFLLQNKTVWEDIFSDKAQKIEKDVH